LIVAYIDEHKARFGVEPICRVLSEHGIPIAPSTYYARAAGRVSQADWDDAHIANRLLDLWRANRSVYGVEKLAGAARRAGMDMGRDQVGRLMAIVGICGVTRGKHATVTTRRDPAGVRHPDRCQRRWSTPVRPDEWWVADFTYVWTLAGFVYVSFVTDVYSRRILGWRVTTSKTTPLVMSALEQALFTRRRSDVRFTATGLVFHSDAGSQYTSLAFTEALIVAGIAGSIGTVGDALDNALMESTIGLYKTEVISQNPASWTGANDVERATAEWVHWYNADRLHTSIGTVPPAEYEAMYLVSTAFPDGEVA
jgi:transposase InsO family protein